MRFVDADGRRLMEMPADFAGGDLEVRRGDLARVLCEAAATVPSTSSATASPP